MNDIDQTALEIARAFIPVDVVGQQRANLQVAIIEAIKKHANPKTLADVQPGGRVRLGDAPWPEIDAILADAYSAGAVGLPFEGVARRHAVRAAVAALSAQPSPGGQRDSDEDAYVIERLSGLLAEIAVIINGPQPAGTRWSYHDLPEKVRALAARQPVGEPVAATDAMVEAALQSTVANNASPWRQVVSSEDHADFISDMRAAINAALAARPSPITAEATTTSTQTVPDHCDRIFWQHNYYQLPIGPTDQKKPTKRRQAAVETVLSLGYLWRNDEWTAPPAQADQEYLESLDRALEGVIDQRDRCEEVADELADHIARITGVDIGEHSSANCPWQNAIEAAEEYKPAQAVELGQFRALAEFGEEFALSAEKQPQSRVIYAQARRLLALIDSQAVGE
ncbi:hypothetical protein [Stenotrophomonas sp. RAC2]|uniref:hypothetical protein n=1 Tax=Stenotrophomonas sp. RAC2 TaxID=3064902 RepID=UPI00271DF2E1|nr:hypothetical protein [Stenotrophomonas sp. RAC2]MDV9040945.1 hypothetical protein [Stenotrophomonas sp. RAC2]